MSSLLIHTSLRCGALPLMSLLAACTAGFNSTPYAGGDPAYDRHKGVSYKLPRTVVDYSVKYTLYRLSESKDKVTYAAWVDAGDDGATGPVTLTTQVVGDETAVFVIPTDDLAKFSVWTKKSEFTLTEDGILTAVNGEFEDRSGEIAKKFVSAGLKLGKLAANPAMAAFFKGRTAGGEEAPQYPRIEEVATVTTSGVIDYAGLVRQHGAANDLRFTVPNGTVVRQFQKLSFGKPLTVPTVNICFRPQANHPALTAFSARESLKKTRAVSKPVKFKGVWVRQPMSVPVAILADGETLLTTQLKIADAGPTTLVPVKSRAFTTRTTNLSIHGTSGSVSKHEFTTTSQGEGIATTTEEIAGQLEEGLPAIAEAIKGGGGGAASSTQGAPPPVMQAMNSAQGRKAEAAVMDMEALEREMRTLSKRYEKLDIDKTALTHKEEEAEEQVKLLQAAVKKATEEVANAASDAAAKAKDNLKDKMESLKISEERLGEVQEKLQSVKDEMSENAASKTLLERQKINLQGEVAEMLR